MDAPKQTGRAHTLDIGGARVHAVDWEPDHARVDERRILLVHGLGANTISWAPVGQPLAERLGARVTAVDLIGFGRTRALDRAATIATNRAIVEGVLDASAPSVVMGNSMGAVIGAGVAARRPDLVDGLVLVDPALPWARIGPADWWRAARMAPLMVPAFARHAVAARARMLGPERITDQTLALCLADPSRLDPVVRRRLVQLAAERFAYPEAPGAYADAARSLLGELASGAADRDLAAAVRGRPTLLLHGEEDRLVGIALARAAAERHVGLDLEVLDGVGHAPQLEVPERFVEVVATWLDARMEAWEQEGQGTRATASSVSPSGSSSPS